MTHRDLRRSMSFQRGKEANDEDLFLEINDSYSPKQIYFLSNVNINRILFDGRNVETMRVIHSLHVIYHRTV